jgi:DNA-binding transcriptional regulator PaaX
MRNKKIINIISGISEGLLETLTDFLLFETFLIGNSIGKGKTTRGAAQALRQTNQDLSGLNYQSIKRAVNYLKKKGFLTIAKEPLITAAGKRRLSSLLPFYDSKREWDGCIYLITYDICEKNKTQRDRLRSYITTIGAGLLQKSVWLTVYNPEKLIKEYISKNSFEGEILISKMGKAGYIGEESLTQLLSRVFKLEELNDRYCSYLDSFSQLKTKQQKDFNFIKILKDDPQLPFELLPSNWLGDQAYQLYKKAA